MQGGQNEMSESPATWPVPFVATLVIDGREDHVVNMWHNMDMDAGEIYDYVFIVFLLTLKLHRR